MLRRLVLRWLGIETGNAAESDGPVVMGKLKGSNERRYIPFTDVLGEQSAPVIATKGYVDGHAGSGVSKVIPKSPGNNDPEMVSPNSFYIHHQVAGKTYSVSGAGWSDGDTLEIWTDTDITVTCANNIAYGSTTANRINIGAGHYCKFVWFNNWLWLLLDFDTSSPRTN